MVCSREWHSRARSPLRHLCDHWWNEKCFRHVQSSFQSEMSPAQKGICYSWGLLMFLFLLSWKQCKSRCPVAWCNICFSHPFSAEVEAECINGVTISPSCFPYSSAPWHSLYLRSNSGCQHSWDKYIKSTLISFAVSIGCGIIHFLSWIDCSFAFSCQTTVSFYIRGSHISLLGKIIHGDINKACSSNRITHFGIEIVLFLQ